MKYQTSKVIVPHKFSGPGNPWQMGNGGLLNISQKLQNFLLLLVNSKSVRY